MAIHLVLVQTVIHSVLVRMGIFDDRGGGDDHGHMVHIRRILDRLGLQHLHLNLFAEEVLVFNLLMMYMCCMRRENVWHHRC